MSPVAEASATHYDYRRVHYFAVDATRNLVPCWESLRFPDQTARESGDRGRASDGIAEHEILQPVASEAASVLANADRGRGDLQAGELRGFLHQAADVVRAYQNRIAIAVRAGDFTAANDLLHEAVADPLCKAYAAAIALQARGSVPLMFWLIQMIVDVLDLGAPRRIRSYAFVHSDIHGTDVLSCAFDIVDHARQELMRPFLDALAGAGDHQFGNQQDVLEAAYAAINLGYRWSLHLDPREWSFLLDARILHTAYGIGAEFIRNAVVVSQPSMMPILPMEDSVRRIVSIMAVMGVSPAEQLCPYGHAAQTEVFRLVLSALARCNQPEHRPIVFDGGVVLFQTRQAAQRLRDLLLERLPSEVAADLRSPLSGGATTTSQRQVWRNHGGWRGDRRAIHVRRLDEGVELAGCTMRLRGPDLLVEPSKQSFELLATTLVRDFRDGGRDEVERHLLDWAKSFPTWSRREAFSQRLPLEFGWFRRSAGFKTLRRTVRGQIELVRRDVGPSVYVPGMRAEQHRLRFNETGRLCPPNFRLQTKWKLN
jgi:hypothetical protein